MKILIDGQTLLTPEINRGIGTYFKSTVEQMLENDFTNEFYLNTPAGSHIENLPTWTRNKLTLIHNDIAGRKRHLPELYSEAVNNDIAKFGIDLYWSPNALMHNVFIPSRQAADCTFAVTIFDLIPLVMAKEYAKHLSAAALETLRSKLKQMETDFDLFLHISEHTRSDFVSALPAADKTHVVTPLAAGSAFKPYPFPHQPSGTDYVFYPGGFDPRKNMNRALEAFAKLQSMHGNDPAIRATEFMIVCHLDDASRRIMMNNARDLGIAEKVRLPGFVDDNSLVKLYQKARCLFFPSLYEGFGLPILEGLACGLPVASANTSSLPEVAADFAFYFDPYDIDGMAQALYQALRAPLDTAAKRARYEFSKQFSWQKTALATLNAFQSSVNL
ncbi:MAG TPA: glycosyltransferase family 1 protein [Pyrinomonadaceae bacterium]|nr:glycosyltransferase family 1 protein [Pyrinomonadaceae bacterium]